MLVPEVVSVNRIMTNERQRKDLGNLDDLINSIKEYGIIQPLVLHLQDSIAPRGVSGSAAALTLVLVAGERRLTALKRLGYTELEHGKHFVWLADQNKDDLRRASVELEENLRRKQLTWQEEVQAKAQLLELMQAKHGKPVTGGQAQAALKDGHETGFGVNKLAAMLGESVGKTTQDLQLARFTKIVPALKNEQSKSSALRRAQVMLSVASMRGLDKEDKDTQKTEITSARSESGIEEAEPAPQKELPWILLEGRLEDNVCQIASESVDLVYTDLPFGVDLSQRLKHNTGSVSYSDPLAAVVNLLPTICRESFRVLKPARYAVFWFGWAFYTELIQALQHAGFAVDRTPFVWYKHTAPTESPHMRYGNAYGVALVARKGEARFMRMGQPNFIDLKNVQASERLHIAQQPVELVRRFLDDMIIPDPGATVLDLCAGSGSTGVACLQFGCKVIMCELDPLAIQSIKARMQNELNRTAKS